MTRVTKMKLARCYTVLVPSVLLSLYFGPGDFLKVLAWLTLAMTWIASAFYGCIKPSGPPQRGDQAL